MSTICLSRARPTPTSCARRTPTPRSRASTPRRPRRCRAWSRSSPARILADAKVGGLICGWVVKDKHGQPHKAPPHPVMAARHRALCRRHGGDGGGQQPRRGQGRRRGDQGRLRREARQRRSRQGARQGRARGPCRGAGQPDLRLGDRREGRCRCRLRQGRARHQARPRQQPADPQRHGAARRGGGLRQGHGQLHAVVDVAEPARAAPHPVGLRAGHSRAQAARHRPRRRRRLRQQDLLLRRRDDGHLGGVAGSAGRSSGRPSAPNRS